MKTKFLALALLVVACGGLDPNPNEKAPLATLVGQLSNPANIATSPNGNVRVALLWGRGDEERFETSTDLPVQPVFPSKFQLTLREAPPPAMMFNPFAYQGSSSLPPSPPSPPSSPGMGTMSLHPLSRDPAVQNMRAGIATVVAYEDRNGNGKLDFVDEGATTFVDRIVAANPWLIVVFMDGAVPASNDLRDDKGVLPSPGYNLLQQGSCLLTPTNDGSLPTCTRTPTVWLSISTVLELQITDSPSINEWMCKGERQPSIKHLAEVTSKQGRPTTYPLPTDPKVECAIDGSGYWYGTPATCTTTYLGVCTGSSTTCVSSDVLEWWERPNPVPSDWPCK